MLSENFANPPTLAENGVDYEEWKKLKKMWMKFTKFKKTEQGSVLSVRALKGKSRSLALLISEEEFRCTGWSSGTENGLGKPYLKDQDNM